MRGKKPKKNMLPVSIIFTNTNEGFFFPLHPAAAIKSHKTSVSNKDKMLPFIILTLEKSLFWAAAVSTLEKVIAP